MWYALCFAVFLAVANVASPRSSCITPLPIFHATYEFVGQLENGWYKSGTVVTYNCTEGYDKAGSSSTGSAVCLNGKWKWNVTDRRCCKLPNCGECGPPPTVANARATKTSGTLGTENTKGTRYTYFCHLGYELSSQMSQIRCTSNLTWETVGGNGTTADGVPLDLPECVHTSYDYYDNDNSTSGNPRRRKRASRLSSSIFTSILCFVIILMVIGCYRRRYRNRMRNRGMIVTGGTTTVTTTYNTAPPTMTPGQVIFTPGPPQPLHGAAPYPTQGGMYPPESYPLTAYTSRMDSGHPDAPPPPYGDFNYSKPVKNAQTPLN